MPRIDPLQLLKILSVLLAPNGGIKSQEEVPRLASLMTKFSKKLVSKCIYVSILKATNPELLVMWMSAGGWDLIYNWLSDGVQMQNWPLVNELVELLLICPVDIERLKTNRCPKLIKTLSKNTDATDSVRQLAAEIVKKWLMVVNEVLTKQKEEESEDTEEGVARDVRGIDGGVVSEETAGGQRSVYRIVIRDGKELLAEVVNKDRSSTGETADDISLADVEDEGKDSKQNLKLKKSMEVVLARKIPKERLSDASEASTSSSLGDVKSEEVMSGKSKSDPSKDRRKDKMRQIRKDPDGDAFFEKLSYVKVKSKKPVKSEPVKGKAGEKPGKIASKSKSGTSSSGNKPGSAPNKPPTFPDLSRLGKIPKKVKTEDKTSSEQGADSKKDKSSSSEKRDKDAKYSKTDKEDSKSSKKQPELKKLPAPPPPKPERDSKKYNISIESRKLPPGELRPKTVKTYNSKFRSTGLEEDIPPPPPQTKPTTKSSKTTPTASTSSPTGSDKKALKRTSPPKESQPPEKKLKSEPPAAESPKSGIATVAPVEKEIKVEAKPTPPKPKLHLLQESDSFMDAINAANTMKEPRKRKRRASGSKEDIKKEEPESPTNQSSPALVKPNFKFYQDTLEDDLKGGEDDKKKIKVEKDGDNTADEVGDSNSDNRSPSPPAEVVNTEEEIKNEQKRQNSVGLKGVLVFAKIGERPKRKVTWKETLEHVKYFDLDESERVNVTKTFMDMKQIERSNERQNFAIARKLTNEDTMEEKIRWKVLIPCDAPALPVIPGNNSAEKEIQYAREKTVTPAIYFNKRLIPDSPDEPDLEIHAVTDPAVIPLDDISGNEDSVFDFTTKPWPEPKTSSPPQQEQMLMPHPGGPMMPPVPMPPNFGPGGPVPGVPGGPGFSPNSGPPSLLGPVPGPGPMGFPGFTGPPGPFGPPQPGPGGMGMMPPGDWMGPGPGPGNDMKGPPGGPPGPMPPDMFGPGPPGMMPPPGLLPPPDMPFGMQPPGPMPGPHPDDMNFPPGGPPFMNQGPPGPPGNMYQGPPPFQGNNNNNQGGGNSNWFRSNGPGGRHDDDRDNRGNNRDRGNNFRKRDRGGRSEGRGSGGGSWRSGRGIGDNWRGADTNRLCNNYTRWGNCKTNNCPFRHPK